MARSRRTWPRRLPRTGCRSMPSPGPRRRAAPAWRVTPATCCGRTAMSAWPTRGRTRGSSPPMRRGTDWPSRRDPKKRDPAHGARYRSWSRDAPMRRRSALLLPLLLPGRAAAQDARFGRPPIRLLVPFAPGGGADFTAHVIAPPLAAALGRPVLVENRPGGRGIPGAEAIARAIPDGQILGLTNTAPLGMAPLTEALSYDPDRAFTHIALIAETPSVLLVPAASRFQSFDLYLRAGRSWARGLTFGSPASGSLQHLQ